MIRSIVEITEPGGNIIKNDKTSSISVDLSSKDTVAPAGISINFLDNSLKKEHVLLKVCKHGVDGIEKELTVGKEIGDIKGLIKPITLGYLGLVEAGHSDEKLPAMIDRPDWSDTINWIEEPTRYYVMYKYIEGLTVLDFYNLILAGNYDDNTFYINRIISVIILDILIALRNIHDRGWVHNDLSIENIMITNYAGYTIKLANGDYTKKPTIVIIDLDACEECAHSDNCMESQGPAGDVYPIVRMEALESGNTFNGRLSDICAVGHAFNRIFEVLREVFPKNTYTVYDEVVKILMDETNYSGVEDAISLTHTYITNNNLFPNGTYDSSDASAKAKDLQARLMSPVVVPPTGSAPAVEPVPQTEIEALTASFNKAYRNYKDALSSHKSGEVIAELENVWRDATQRMEQAKKEAEEEDEEEYDGNSSDGEDSI